MSNCETGKMMSIAGGYKLMMKFRNLSEHEHNNVLMDFVCLSFDTMSLFPVAAATVYFYFGPTYFLS